MALRPLLVPCPQSLSPFGADRGGSQATMSSWKDWWRAAGGSGKGGDDDGEDDKKKEGDVPPEAEDKREKPAQDEKPRVPRRRARRADSEVRATAARGGAARC